MRFLLILWVINAIGLSGLTQTSTPSHPDPEVERQRVKQEDNKFLGSKKVTFATPQPETPPVKRPLPPPVSPGPNAVQPNAEQAQRLLPEARDAARYAAFLQQPNTRLFRLFNDLECTDKYIVRVDNPCLETIPLSSFYSFRKQNYSEKLVADLRLKDNSFFTDGRLANGLIVVLGDLPLESVSFATAGMKFLVDYRPASNYEEALSKSKELAGEIRAENYTYAKKAPVMENMTYAIRIIAYRGSLLHQVGKNYFYDELLGDKRVDLIGVFRIVRKDDKNVTLLWKELQRTDAPKIKVPKANK